MKKYLFILIFLLYSVNAEATIAHVQTQKGQATGASHATTTSMTTTTGNLVVLGVINLLNSRYSTTGDNKGNTFTVTDQQTYNTTVGIRQLYSGNITGGSVHTFTSTATTTDDITIFASEFSGGPFTTTPLDKTAKQAQTSTQNPSSTATATRTVAAEVLVGTFGAPEATLTTITAGTNFTIPTNGTVLNGAQSCAGAIEYQVVAAVGTDAATFSFSGSATNVGTIIGTYYVSATAAGPPLGSGSLLGVGK